MKFTDGAAGPVSQTKREVMTPVRTAVRVRPAPAPGTSAHKETP